MNGFNEYAAAELSRYQLAARAEWRSMCFVLEGLQATALLSDDCDKYALARTYLVYRDDHRATAGKVEWESERNDFHFFVDRGVLSTILDKLLARQMLRDWSAAVASKQARIEDKFYCHFGEELDEFVLTAAHAARIRAAVSLEKANAVTLMERWLTGPEELAECFV